SFEQAAKRKGFDPSGKPDSQIQQYRTAAMRLRLRLNECGHMGFDEVRAAAIDRIKTPLVSKRIAAALAARFVEVVVDEAQDCNEEDLELITWLRDSGMSVKVVCDPHQSIYQFRGGVTNHLFAFEETFPPEQRKRLTGNFRSTSNICKAIAQFRPPSVRGFADESRGPFRDDATPIRILSYRGQSVPASVGLSFHSLLEDAGIDATFAPIVAATNRSGSAAAGQPRPTDSNHRTIRLAEAVTTFAFAGGVHDLTSAIDRAHEILLELEGHLDDRSYHQYLRESGIDAGIWRPRVISILRALRFDPVQHSDARGWHAAAKLLLSNELTVCGGHSISQKLKWNSALGTALASAPVNSAMPRTIHSVKGAEFPAVCVV
ncbi:MAG TPA: UvrD-helicase domain-containing protein, partial [Pirellulaceae bacterium]|nr:UvrD-helicase domain-containing protein [Pirellulaceae bacterium]